MKITPPTKPRSVKSADAAALVGNVYGQVLGKPGPSNPPSRFLLLVAVSGNRAQSNGYCLSFDRDGDIVGTVKLPLDKLKTYSVVGRAKTLPAPEIDWTAGS